MSTGLNYNERLKPGEIRLLDFSGRYVRGKAGSSNELFAMLSITLELRRNA